MAKLESCQSRDVSAVKSGALDGIDQQARDDRLHLNKLSLNLWLTMQ